MIMHKEPNPALTEGDAETAKEQIIGPNAYLPDTTFSIQKALRNIGFTIYYYTLKAQFFHNSRSLNLCKEPAYHNSQSFT